MGPALPMPFASPVIGSITIGGAAPSFDLLY
jgi:hypothetical protein